MYTSLAKEFESPFSPSAEMARAWLSYDTRKVKELHQPLFGQETFDVTQVYVPLRAYYEEQVKDKMDSTPEERSHFDPEQDTIKRVVGDLKTWLTDWIINGRTEDTLRVIAGDPGSGKSTFTMMLAARTDWTPGVKVLRIPLHRFNMRGNVKDAVAEFAQEALGFPGNPWDYAKVEEPMLIIFDGLDELPLKNSETRENARQFLQELRNRLENINTNERRLLALVMGRTVMIEITRTEIREPRQLLRLLPYYLAQNDQNHFYDPGNLLETDQRQKWWENYGLSTGKLYKGLPDQLVNAGPRLDDLTAQPLLNYLIALSMDRGRVVFDKNTNLNSVYQDLLSNVYDGIHNRNRKNLVDLNLSEQQFVKVLGKIAVSSWHGEGRTTTLTNVRSCCKSVGLKKILDQVGHEAESGPIRLLAAFYFRQYGGVTKGNEVFEFTHKSFMEYLVAVQIVDELFYLDMEMNRYQETYETGLNSEAALVRWTQLCGPASIDGDLLRFLRDEIRFRGAEKAIAWQGMIGKLIGYALRKGMPIEKMGLPNFKEQTIQSLNAQETLLAAASACGYVTKKFSNIDWPDSSTAGQWFMTLRGFRFNRQNDSYRFPAAYLDLSCRGLGAPSNAATDLSGVNLKWADFTGADLTGANLRGAYLWGANFQKANLARANLREANLRKADLREACLDETDLSGANLMEINLSGTELTASGMQLERAGSLCGAKFSSRLEQKVRDNCPRLLLPRTGRESETSRKDSPDI
jgi:uncharacterized protein YjbI with pentapeptide repeats